MLYVAGAIGVVWIIGGVGALAAGNDSPAGRVAFSAFTAAGAAMVVAVVRTVQRNHVVLDDQGREIVVTTAGVTERVPYGDAVVDLPAEPAIVPGSVVVRAGAGTSHRCGLLSQGRFATPRGLGALGDALDERDIAWRRVD